MTQFSSPVRLHLGCGNRFIPGFVHVDALQAPHVDVVGPVDRLAFDDGSVDMIYASHLLEHFGRHEYLGVLLEWRRVLRVGGLLRLAVPDFAACARLYVEERLTGGIHDILGLVSGGQKDQYDFHKMIFDRQSLETALSSAGFANVREWNWRTTEHSGVDDFSQAYLPHMDKHSGVLVSLNVEADAA